MNNNLDYIELICEISPNLQKHREVLTAKLTKNGFESFMETKKGINAYIPENKFNILSLNNFEEKFFNFKIKISHKIIKDENWNETWTENYFEPIIFGNKLVIRASFHPKFTNVENEIIIDPKTAFGTGYHATTYMLIEEIMQINTENKSVLDMGTGTGILAILSKMQKSAYTYAVDIDPKSVTNTSENIIINKTPDIDVALGDTSVLKNEIFDIIYENIWKNIVIADLPLLEKHLMPGGIVLLSGFYYKEYEEVKEAGEKIGLKFQYAKEKDGWAIIKFLKHI